MNQASTGKGTLVRVAQTTITKRSLSTFLQMYELRILPMYKALPGILAVRLYIEDPSLSLSSPSSSTSSSSSSTDDGSITNTATNLPPEKAHVHIQSITEWTTYETMMDETVHNPSSNYIECMKQLSTYFRDVPKTYLMTQAINHDLRYVMMDNNNQGISKGKKKATVKQEDRNPGPELGLR